MLWYAPTLIHAMRRPDRLCYAHTLICEAMLHTHTALSRQAAYTLSLKPRPPSAYAHALCMRAYVMRIRAYVVLVGSSLMLALVTLPLLLPTLLDVCVCVCVCVCLCVCV